MFKSAFARIELQERIIQLLLDKPLSGRTQAPLSLALALNSSSGLTFRATPLHSFQGICGTWGTSTAAGL